MYCILKIHATGTRKPRADRYVHYLDCSNSITGIRIRHNLTKLQIQHVQFTIDEVGLNKAI